MKSEEPTGYRTILGVNFFGGTAQQAVERMRSGGLLVVPAAPALKDLSTNRAYREALLHADLAIPDSAFMVMVWNLLEKDKLVRVSGLEYLRALLSEPELKTPANSFWIMASAESAARNLNWLKAQGIELPKENIYIAPMYGAAVEDPGLLKLLEEQKPRQVFITLGGGTQERLGHYLKGNLDWLPAIHCIGAAIAFLSGDQVKIPVWADRIYLGWLLRCLSEPRRYVPRYWAARKLLTLMVRYRDRLPEVTP